jgi:hypothetical protein
MTTLNDQVHQAILDCNPNKLIELGSEYNKEELQQCYDYYQPAIRTTTLFFQAISQGITHGEQVVVRLAEALVHVFGIGNLCKYNPDDVWSSSIFLAVRFGYTEVVKKLAELGCDLNIRTPIGYTALYQVAGKWRCSIPMIETLVALGMNMDDVGNNIGETPLLNAVCKDAIDAVAAFIRLGSQAINTPNNRGATPLHLAQTDKMIEMLVKFGANTFDTFYDGMTPFMMRISEITYRYHIFPSSNGAKSLAALDSSVENRKLYEGASGEIFGEDEVAEIRYRVYFCSSLVVRLLE